MSQSWNHNKILLSEIVEEMIVRKRPEHADAIFQQFENIMQGLYKHQYSFKNYVQLNKHVLEEMNEYAQHVYNSTSKPRQNNTVELSGPIDGRTQGVTREDIKSERDSIFKQRLKEKQREMDNMETKPETIDFTDKTDEPSDSIDDLLERELARRNQNIEYTPAIQTQANDWINNSDSSIKPLKISNEVDKSNVIDLTIVNDTSVGPPNVNHDNKTTNTSDNVKQVHFEDETIKQDSMKQFEQRVEKNVEEKVENKKLSRSIIQKTGIEFKKHVSNNDLKEELTSIKTKIDHLHDVVEKLSEVVFAFVERNNDTTEPTKDITKENINVIIKESTNDDALEQDK